MSIYEVLDELKVTPRMAYDAVKAVQGKWISAEDYQDLVDTTVKSGAVLRWTVDRSHGMVKIETITVG